MSGIIAGYLPHLPPTPGPTGAETGTPLPVPYPRNEASTTKRRMGAPPKPVIVGELFGCWRVVEQSREPPEGGRPSQGRVRPLRDQGDEDHVISAEGAAENAQWMFE